MQPSSVIDDAPLAPGLTREYLLHHRCCPKGIGAEGLLIVAAAPDALLDDAGDDLGRLYQCRVVIENASSDEVERLIERLATRWERSIELQSAGSADVELTADARDLATQPPVIRYVNLLVRDAFDVGASDIHLEATRHGLSVRFRIDGVLAPAQEPPIDMQHAVVSRIKLLAELDIAERRRPQDGRIRVRLDVQELDLRVSCVPTMYGESVVLRLLDRGARPVNLPDLGMPEALLHSFERLVARPHGMTLVTGPTGSGKTTTLYAALRQREAHVEKIITVEDPIEYQLTGITQVPVHRQAGVTFGTALRSILRQDPDVVMVGEIRDGETAEMAMQAAMTGHLVLSTLHTTDAIGAIPRLLDLGVPSYLVAATVDGVLAQRLVRRICGGCRTDYLPEPDTIALVAPESGWHGQLTRGLGCAECRGSGYRGRLGIFELLHMTDELKDAVSRNQARSTLRTIALGGGVRALQSDGWSKVLAGVTTVEEVLRVVQE